MKIIRKAKKSLGQNFLIDKNIINKIVKLAKIDKSKTIMEIGSGYGNLTNAILNNQPKKILAIEKDKNLYSFLKNKFENNNSIEIINNDILNIISKENLGENIIVFGNLPYNISTKILSTLILIKKWPPWYESLILMFQKEVADRIIAKPGTREFGRLTILSNWRLKIRKHFDISNNCFFPKPKISSTVLSFTPIKKNLFNLKNPKNLEIVTRILFSNRRKMINKNFNKLFKKSENVAKKLNIRLDQRPEDLESEVFYKIALHYENLFC